MALESGKTMPELKKLCDKLGIVVTFEKKENKTDYIIALRKYFIDLKYGDKPPTSLVRIMEMDTPMLCSRYTELKPEQQKDLWELPNWYMEEKLDGARMMMCCFDKEISLFSRHNSIEDFLPINFSKNVYLPNVDWNKFTEHDFILDCELMSTSDKLNTVLEKSGVVTETQLQAVTALLGMLPDRAIEIQMREGSPLQFVAFDCVMRGGQWIKDKPLKDRLVHVQELHLMLKSAGVPIARPKCVYSVEKRKLFYNWIVAKGGEGIVAKNLDSSYIDSTSRKKDCWVKIKRSVSESLKGSGIDSLDAYITGFVPGEIGKRFEGMVGSLRFSVILRSLDGSTREHEIAVVGGFSDELRRDLTETVNGQVSLKAEYYGKVAELDGQDITPRVLRFAHARIIRWRPDRSADTCIMEEEDIQKLVL